MCGIFGYCAEVWQPDLLEFFKLQAALLQHRGYENFGCGYANGEVVEEPFKGEGEVVAVFTPERQEKFLRFKPTIAIGHTRYCTAGGGQPRFAQPHWAEILPGRYVLASNGHLPMLRAEQEFLEKNNIALISSRDDQGNRVDPNDAEIILRKILFLVENNGGDITKGIGKMMETTQGAYSCCLMVKDRLFLFRDPYGFRPLCFGKWGDTWVFASESCALVKLGAYVEREVRPGELVMFDPNGKFESIQLVPPRKYQHCPFEWIYFARPDSRVFGVGQKDMFAVRYELGREVAREFPVGNAIVAGIPDSGVPAAVGYARESGNGYKVLFVSDRHIRRTFMAPNKRKELARLKYSVMRSLLDSLIEKIRLGTITPPVILVIVDDSIVRLTTLRELIAMIKETWVELGGDLKNLEIHVRVSSPPIIGPCYYGIDTPTHAELVAASHTEEEIAGMLEIASVRYLTIGGLDKVLTKFAEPFNESGNFCFACFKDEYPTPVQSEEES